MDNRRDGVLLSKHPICLTLMPSFLILSRKLDGARVAQWQRNRLVIGRLAGSNPLSGLGTWVPMVTSGGVPEWLIGAVCKIAALTGFAGSNPAPSTTA